VFEGGEPDQGQPKRQRAGKQHLQYSSNEGWKRIEKKKKKTIRTIPGMLSLLSSTGNWELSYAMLFKYFFTCEGAAGEPTGIEDNRTPNVFYKKEDKRKSGTPAGWSTSSSCKKLALN